jgi:hypothetical protein
MKLIPSKLKEWENMSVLTASRLGWSPRDNTFSKVERDNIEAWMRIDMSGTRPDLTPQASQSFIRALGELLVAAIP